MSHDEGPRVELWGGFDVENYGDALFPRIFEVEMRRRLRGAAIRYRSPLGSLRPLHMNRGWPLEPLGTPDDARRARLAEGADLVVIGGGEIAHVRDDLLASAYGLEGEEAERFEPSGFFLEGLGERHERDVPVAWHGLGVPFDFDREASARVRAALARRAYVAVRDEDSLARLRRAGFEGEATVVPDSVLLLPRLLDRSVLDDRLAGLRRRGLFPDEPPLVVQGAPDLIRVATRLAGTLEPARRGDPPRPVVLVATGPALGDERFLDALANQLPQPLHRLPSDVDIEDIAAAISGAAAWVGSSLHGAITAMAYGRPLLMLNLDQRAKLSGVGRALGLDDHVVTNLGELAPRLLAMLDVPPAYRQMPSLERRLDRHFDRLASLASEPLRR